jgi:DNA-directed RNA polymerase subunit RPC12/RpoP
VSLSARLMGVTDSLYTPAGVGAARSGVDSGVHRRSLSSMHPPELPGLDSQLPPSGRKFPCPKCGARLDFEPTAGALRCPYCHHTQPIRRGAADTWENDLEAALQRLHSARAAPRKGRDEVRCGGCGAAVLMDDKVRTDRCPYCATHLVSEPTPSDEAVPAEWVVPFALDRRQAAKAFDEWLGGLWFAPGALRKAAMLGRLAGLYVPYWTFDSMTYSWYAGERGDDYKEDETYTERDAEGNAVTKTRTVTKTRWVSVSGEVRHFFDDVLVCGSVSLPAEYALAVVPGKLEHLEEFRDEFLSGFLTERYTVGPAEGFGQARRVMEGHIRRLCARDIGGDHQRLYEVETQHVGVTFKQVLLPVWVTAYRFRDRPYRVLINGRTGKVVGDRPWSWWKIALLVLGILLGITAIGFLISWLAR